LLNFPHNQAKISGKSFHQVSKQVKICIMKITKILAQYFLFFSGAIYVLFFLVHGALALRWETGGGEWFYRWFLSSFQYYILFGAVSGFAFVLGLVLLRSGPSLCFSFRFTIVAAALMVAFHTTAAFIMPPHLWGGEVMSSLRVVLTFFMIAWAYFIFPLGIGFLGRRWWGLCDAKNQV
jgi:hypothetical protein